MGCIAMTGTQSNILDTLDGIKKRSILGSWVSRLSSAKSSGQALVHPCIINGQHTLIHERGLQQSDPESYAHILEFARSNGFNVREDQRRDFIEGVKRVRNKRRANVMTVMALTATMMSQAVSAKADSDLDTTDEHHIEHHDDHHMHDFDFDLESYDTEAEMVSAMFNWINQHSSFDHDVSMMPEIKKVSAKKIAEVAFGGTLPQAVDPLKLQIYGLYNFNEGAVYILDSLDMKSEQGKGILLHELVHYLQYQYNQDENVQCKNELESLAYILEARFLQSHGHNHNITDAHIDRVSQCA